MLMTQQISNNWWLTRFLPHDAL